MKKLAKVTYVYVEYKECTILNFWIKVTYEEDGSQNIRIDATLGYAFLKWLLNEAKVSDFSKMIGKHIWVFGKGKGYSFTPTGISLLRVDDGTGLMFRTALGVKDNED